MKHLLLTISLFISLLSSGQVDYTKHADLLLNAYRALDKNDPKNALDLYEKAFAIHDDNSIAEYLNAANCAAKLKDEDSCKEWIIKSIETKKTLKSTLIKFSDNDLYQKCLNDILPNYQNHLASYYSSIENPMAFFLVQELTNRDQFSRRLKDYDQGITSEAREVAFKGYLKAQAKKDTVAMNKYKAIVFPKVDKVYRDYNHKIMRYTDSLNIVKLIDITKEYGWQKEGWLLLWHQRGTYGQDNWVWNYFKPYINNEIVKGKISPFFWAKFEDISSIYKSGKSIYGYHPGKVDPKVVNRNRKSIGLPLLTATEIEQRNTRRDNGRVF